jgi:hypothetical protein
MHPRGASLRQIAATAATIVALSVLATLVANVHVEIRSPCKELVDKMTQLVPAARKQGNLTQPVPAARKEASPRMRAQGIIESKELENLTELAVDEIKKWSGYRLGDILRFWRRAFLSWRGTGPFQPFKRNTGNRVNVGNPAVCRKWPTSLGCLFLKISKSRVPSKTKQERQKYTARKKREKLFTDILGETLRGQGKDIPSADTVVVHVRLSDVLTRDNCGELPPCKMGRLGIYAYPFSWYDTVVQEIRNINTTLGGGVFKVVVVGYAYHYGRIDRIRRSNEYRSRLVEYFKHYGFNASARPEHLPDDDFLYMTKAKFFVPGGGGFSSMIAEICRSHGGQVFSVKQD